MTQHTESLTRLSITPMATAQEAEAFRALNEEWITTLFTMEDEDHYLLGDPQGHIIDIGGVVLIARLDDRIVGAVAIVPAARGAFKLSKMVVAPDLRGHGIGRAIVLEAIARARRMGGRELYLGSSTKLPSAVHVYESIGFRHISSDELGPLPNPRTDVFMKLALDSSPASA